MGFNYAREKAKFTAEWNKLEKWYKEQGMSQESIEKMREFDWNVFKKNRIYIIHNQELPDNVFGDKRGVLTEKFENLKVDFPENVSSDKYSWVDSIMDEELLKKIKKLSDDYLDIITMLMDGYTQEEIGKERNVKKQAICNKIKRIKKILK